MSNNDAAGISFAQPTTFDERFGIAEQCSDRLNMATPVLIDSIDNQTADDYAAFPDRLYIVDIDGKIAYKGGRGPFGYKPKEMEQTLVLLIMDAQLRDKSTSETKPSEKPDNEPPAPPKAKGTSWKPSTSSPPDRPQQKVTEPSELPAKSTPAKSTPEQKPAELNSQSQSVKPEPPSPPQKPKVRKR